MDGKLQPHSSLIEQFLNDVRDHFRASLEISEYANTSNVFHLTAAEATESLLHRCEQLLEHSFAHNGQQPDQNENNRDSGLTLSSIPAATATAITNANDCTANTSPSSTTEPHHEPTLHKTELGGSSAYLDMSGPLGKKSGTREAEFGDSTTSVPLQLNNCGSCNKTLKAPVRAAEVPDLALAQVAAFIKDVDRDSDYDEGDSQLYDICQVSQTNPDESLKPITPELDLLQNIDCPYLVMPASHMAIENPSKYGQLQRVEKRLFFDQTKKCYCGILNDWLLCYADGTTATRPTLTLYLKGSGIEIEHYGEGKRRELSFQITTADPNKKFIFQAGNEVDAKEWIVAVEAAIRGDSATVVKSVRKLPTPPDKKTSAVSEDGVSNCSSTGIYQNNDYIYEVPTPHYKVQVPVQEQLVATINLTEKELDLPEKDTDGKFEYDIPKHPAQPVEAREPHRAESETTVLLNLSEPSASPLAPNDSAAVLSNAEEEELEERRDFNTIIKDVHNKLSSQLSAGPNNDRLKKALKKTYSNSSTDSENIVLATPPAFVMDNKKLRTSSVSTPNDSPQRNNKKPNEAKPEKPEKSAKNWFLIRRNKNTRSSTSSTPSPKSKQGEKQNLLSLEWYDNDNDNNNSNSSNPQSADECDNSPSKSVNMIIKELEASGHVGMFSMEALTHNMVAAFHENDSNYEPIMAMSTPANSLVKKV